MSFWKMITEFLTSLFAKLSAPAVPGRAEERPSSSDSGQKLLWCPFAERGPKMKVVGKYPKGYPEGAVVHWTSGSSASSSIEYGISQGYNFWMIDRHGKIYQPCSLDGWGYHAGASSWPSLGSSLSNRLVGIEIDNCGKLEKQSDGSFKAWFGRKLQAESVRISPKKDNIAAGAYEKFTSEQEEALEHLLLWLKSNNPDVFKIENVLGHDEISPGRKTDPGASLSVSMPEFRDKLKRASLRPMVG